MERIQSYAFANCNLKSLELPKTVKNIGHGIVYKNANLNSIQTAGNYFKMQKGVLTTKSGKTLIVVISQKGAVHIPSGVAYMRGMAVSNPPEVTAMKFPISRHTFYQITIPLKIKKCVTENIRSYFNIKICSYMYIQYG